MGAEEVLSGFARIAKERQNFYEDVIQPFCQNPENPLADRWRVFVETGAGEAESWIHHFSKLDAEAGTGWEDMLNDGSMNGRNEVINLPNKIEGQEEDLAGGDAYEWVTQEAIDALKEYCLENWLRSYEFDW